MAQKELGDPGPAQLAAQASDAPPHGYKVAAFAPEVTADMATPSEEDHLSWPPQEQGNTPKAPSSWYSHLSAQISGHPPQSGDSLAILPKGLGRGMGNTQQNLALVTS